MLMSRKKSIGIFGGSFDPPHKGHVKITKICLKKMNFEKIYWVVTKQNPFKKKTTFSLNERMVKSRKAVKKIKKIKVLFLDRKVKSSRTINIVNYLKKINKKKKLYLILGSDNLISFHKWTSWRKIVKLTKLVVFSRKGYGKKNEGSTVENFLKKENIIYMNNKFINVSSSNIRRNYHKKYL